MTKTKIIIPFSSFPCTPIIFPFHLPLSSQKIHSLLLFHSLSRYLHGLCIQDTWKEEVPSVFQCSTLSSGGELRGDNSLAPYFLFGGIPRWATIDGLLKSMFSD